MEAARFVRSRVSGPALILMLLAVAPPAAGGELVIEEVGVDHGELTVAVHLRDAFDDDTRSSLASGLPITVRFTTELWRHRSRWWDKQIASRVSSYRIRWDPGARVYQIHHPGPPRRDTFDDLDSLLDDLARRTLAVHGRWELEDRHRYFVLVEAAIRPLTLEEFRELDGWIGGQIRGGPEDSAGRDPAEEGNGGIAQAFFRLLVNLSGFGDVILEARTPGFRPGDLRPMSPQAPAEAPLPVPR